MLKLCAINLNDCAGVSKQDLGSRFHNAGLSGAGRAQKEQVPNGAAGGVQPRTEHLEHVHQGLNALFLAYDLGA
jgi:hypothetical protein